MKQLLTRERDPFVVGLFQNSIKTPPSEHYIFFFCLVVSRANSRGWVRDKRDSDD